jgi:membrane-bound serine protease (ClpP class)
MKYGRYTAYSIITTLLEEAVLVAAVLWLLPRFGINIPLWGLSLMVVALGVYAYITYQLGKKALEKEAMISPEVGRRGRATTPISPKGYVRVRGELWQASSSSFIDTGEEVTVMGMDGMTLLVSPIDNENHQSKADTLLEKH